MSAVQVIFLMLLGGVLLGIITCAAALWLTGRLFRVQSTSWRRALIASSIFMLLSAGLAGAGLAGAEEFPEPVGSTSASGLEIVLTALMCFFIALLFVKLALRISFRRAFLPSLTFVVLWLALYGGATFAIRWWLVAAYEIPTNAMAPTLLGRHTTIPCGKCGAALTCGLRVDSATGVPILHRGQVVSCSRCGGPVKLAADPRILSGDRILVDRTSMPARWELFVFRYPVDPAAVYVQRLVGLPGETLEIAGGEVFSDGKLQKKTPGAVEELWIPVHEDDGAPAGASHPEESGWKPEREPSSWSRIGTGWRFDGAGEERLVFRGRIDDRLDYNALYDQGAGAKPVGDARVECVVERVDGAGSLAFEWKRGARTVEAEVTADGAVELRSGEANATGNLGPVTRGIELAFSVRDAQAYFSSGDRVVCSLDIDFPGLEAFRGPEGELPARLAIAARRSGLEIRRLAVLRDIHYRGDLPPGRGRGADRVTLGPAEYFVLGDNPMSSSDSRLWGAVPAANSCGVARWIFWPFERITDLPRRSTPKKNAR